MPSSVSGRSWQPAWGARTYVMGVINVTPDSFSGDGLAYDGDAVARRGAMLATDGADLIDVGGESTRPAFLPVPLSEELRRTLPVVKSLAQRHTPPVSIDTTKPEVAHAAIRAGASVVNDVSGLADGSMLEVVASAGCTYVLVHNNSADGVPDVSKFVVAELGHLIERAMRAGIDEDKLVIDPGLGFGKTWRQNLEIMANLSDLRALGMPILIGPSRKATVSRVLGVGLHDRLEGTAALVAVGIAHGADVIRVHDCLEMGRVARMVDALARPLDGN